MRVGLVGLGVMGRNHYRVIRSLPNVELAAVCDPLVGMDLSERHFTSVHAMLTSAGLDAVVAAVPTSHHLSVATEVISAGVPLLIEKPIASSIEEADELIALAEKHKVRTAVGHVERFNPVIRSLMAELKGKEIYSINITRIGPFPPQIKDVGVLVDLSVHDVDLVHCLTHGAQLAEARVFKSTKREGRQEDNAVVTMRLENDVVASITTNWLTPFKKRTIEVATDKAFYTADLMSQELLEYSEYAENNSFVVRKCFVRKGEPLVGEIKAFLEYAKSGDRDGLASLEDGLRTLQTIFRQRTDGDTGARTDIEALASLTANHGAVAS